MIKVIGIAVEEEDNPGCNNGNYPHFRMALNCDGRLEFYDGNTCRCHKGCSNTDRLPSEGQVFTNMNRLLAFMRS